MKRFLSVLLIAVLFFLSCDSSPPELQQIYWQLNVKDDLTQDKVYEALSLWVQVRDEDGQDDIEFVYLINDNDELLWTVSADSWETAEQPGESWLGSNFITSSDLSGIPRGEYRVVVIDTVGERDERSFYISTKENNYDTLSVPKASVDGDILTVSNAAFGFTIWGYDAQGKFIKSIKDRYNSIDVKEVAAGIPNIHHYYIYSYDINGGYGFISGPYQWEDAAAATNASAP